jgi:tetrahydromethanopterin S-methyltransferase subunit B
LGVGRSGYFEPMLYTVFIVLAIVALLLFIFGRRRV